MLHRLKVNASICTNDKKHLAPKYSILLPKHNFFKHALHRTTKKLQEKRKRSPGLKNE